MSMLPLDVKEKNILGTELSIFATQVEQLCTKVMAFFLHP